MIKTRTTLVLGAGASKPFGFPLGTQLVDEICHFIDRSPETLQHAYIHRALDTDQNDLKKFKNVLIKSGNMSIDAFLENHTEVKEIGKALIASVISSYESSNMILNANRAKGHWYFHLFKKIGNSAEDLKQSMLSIITFNYDRSLEYFLYHAIKNSYSVSKSECIDLLKQIPIIHFHGKLGELYEIDSDGRRYRPEIGGEKGLKKCTESINIVHEDLMKSPQVLKARELLQQSERIVFLGFGYDPINIERLGIKGISGREKKLTGSAFGLTKLECVNIVVNNFAMASRYFDLLDFQNGEIMDFLRKHTPFDPIWSGSMSSVS